MAWLQSLFGASSQKKVAEAASPVDVITYLASLASNPREIDPILDDLREITARQAPGEPLSERDQQMLVGIYNKLTQYLLERELLRKFSPDELESKVQQRFGANAAAVSLFHGKAHA